MWEGRGVISLLFLVFRGATIYVKNAYFSRYKSKQINTTKTKIKKKTETQRHAVTIYLGGFFNKKVLYTPLVSRRLMALFGRLFQRFQQHFQQEAILLSQAGKTI